MKRRDLVRHLERHGCKMIREGSAHSVFVNRAIHKVTTVPRNKEINEFLARRICKDLEVPHP